MPPAIPHGARPPAASHRRARARTAGLLAVLALLPGCAAGVADRAEPVPGQASFAVIGDLPYGRGQQQVLPLWVDEINAAQPDFVVHVGDIMDGQTDCTDAEYQRVRRQFQRFGALVYTPGDNEWTDCHRRAKGGFDPLERLVSLRGHFFPDGQHTLGTHPLAVTSQASRGHVENVRFEHAGVVVATVHVTGSLDGTVAWLGLGERQPNRRQLTDQRQRLAAAIANVREAYAQARAHGARAVVVATQENLFQAPMLDRPDDLQLLAPLVRTLSEESAAFAGDSYLFNGESHRFESTLPLTRSSLWLSRYRVPASPRLVQVTVDGGEDGDSWLRVTVEPPGSPQALRWQRVAFRAQAQG